MPSLGGAGIFVHFRSLTSFLASLRSLYPRFSLLTVKEGKASASVKASEKKTAKEASAGGVKSDQYWSEREPVLVTFRPSQTRIQRGSTREHFPFESGAQKKFGGENKPSGGTGLYICEAKLLI